jgi:hypothetical protein
MSLKSKGCAPLWQVRSANSRVFYPSNRVYYGQSVLQQFPPRGKKLRQAILTDSICRTIADRGISRTPVFLRTIWGQNERVVINRSCRLFKFGIGFGVVLACLSACTLARAVSSASLQWDLNTDPSIVGYNVYYGGESRSYTNVLSVGNLNNAMIPGLVEGKTYYFAVTAYNASGEESDYSNETTFIVPGFLTLTPGNDLGEPMHIRFPVAVSHFYELQVSEDLKIWRTVWQVIGVSNMWVQYDAPMTSSVPQFFRVVLH